MSETNNQGVRVGDRFHREYRFTPQHVTDFSLAAGDDNSLHLDSARVAASPYGALIVSGTHTSALLLRQTASHFFKFRSAVGRHFTVQFMRGVRADAGVTIEWRIVALTPRAGRPGQVVSLEGKLRETVSGEVCVTGTGEVVIGL